MEGIGKGLLGIGNNEASMVVEAEMQVKGGGEGDDGGSVRGEEGVT